MEFRSGRQKAKSKEKETPVLGGWSPPIAPKRSNKFVCDACGGGLKVPKDPIADLPMACTHCGVATRGDYV